MVPNLQNIFCKRKFLQISLILLSTYMLSMFFPMWVILETALYLQTYVASLIGADQNSVSLETVLYLHDLEYNLKLLNFSESTNWFEDGPDTPVIRRPSLETNSSLKGKNKASVESEKGNIPTNLDPLSSTKRSRFQINPRFPKALDSENVRNIVSFVEFFLKNRIYESHRRIFKTLLEIFDKTMTENDLLYFLYSGTLIGSYRHHDMTPWDDDVDVMVPLSHQLAIHAALTKLKPDIILNTVMPFWKLYNMASRPLPLHLWRWPFLDIFFYDENATHIWDHYWETLVWPKSIIFPVRRRPFMGLTLLAPHNPRAVIAQNYDIRMCQTGNYSHRQEQTRISEGVPCALLRSFFPFVERTDVPGGCNETLKIGEKILGHFFDNGFSC